MKKIEEEALNDIKNSLNVYSQLDDIEEVDIKGVDSNLKQLEDSTSYLKNINNELLKIEKLIYHHLYCNPLEKGLLIRIMNIDISFPLSLCGFATQGYMEKGNKKTAYVILNIIPLKFSTYIVCLAHEKDREIFIPYYNFLSSNPLNTLNMIESFMINGSDHWYINPDYWENFSKQKQEKILFDILNTEDSFIDEYSISIFDDIRSKLISIFDENTKHRKLSEVEKDSINREKQKIKKV